MKKPRRPARIDWDELEIAFDWSDPEGHACLDLETGEVVRWWDTLDEDERAEVTDRIDGDPDRCERIEPIPSGEGWRWMADFAATVAADDLRDRLDQALRGRGAFRRFRQALAGDPAERERWFAFRDDRLHGAIEGWLAELGIEVANPTPWAVRGPEARRA